MSMPRLLLALLLVSLSSCATFDKTNILPGQRIPGLGFSFLAPTEKPWFAVVFGNSNRIRLGQLNDKDSYSINIALNQGPPRGMYTSAESHLKAFKKYKEGERLPAGVVPEHLSEWIDTRYGKLCVRFRAVSKDHRGRYNRGPALVEVIGLSCAHEKLRNTLISVELTRRADLDAGEVDLSALADHLFDSIEYESLD